MMNSEWKKTVARQLSCRKLAADGCQLVLFTIHHSPFTLFDA
jgi:hypothetical protein